MTAVQPDGREGGGRAPNKVLQRSWAANKHPSEYSTGSRVRWVEGDVRDRWGGGGG